MTSGTAILQRRSGSFCTRSSQAPQHFFSYFFFNLPAFFLLHHSSWQLMTLPFFFYLKTEENMLDLSFYHDSYTTHLGFPIAFFHTFYFLGETSCCSISQSVISPHHSRPLGSFWQSTTRYFCPFLWVRLCGSAWQWFVTYLEAWLY